MYLSYWLPEWEELTEKEIENNISYSTEMYTVLDEKLFHIDEGDPETVVCICGSKDFTVGKSLYFTGLKCKNCENEFCIHEG